VFYSNVLHIPFESLRRNFTKRTGLDIHLLDINFNITKPIFLCRFSDLKLLRRVGDKDFPAGEPREGGFFHHEVQMKEISVSKVEHYLHFREGDSQKSFIAYRYKKVSPQRARIIFPIFSLVCTTPEPISIRQLKSDLYLYVT
jgi:hypothetical protein